MGYGCRVSNNRMFRFSGEVKSKLMTQLLLLDINKVTHLNSSSTFTGSIEQCRRKHTSQDQYEGDLDSGVYFMPATLG